MPAGGQQSARRDLGGRVDRLQVGGRTRGRRRSRCAQLIGCRVARGSRAQANRQLGGDRRRAGGVRGRRPAAAAAERPRVELEAQRPAQPQVVLARGGRTRSSTRSAPGHGWASVRRLVEIDPGVDGGADQAAVTQHLADLEQRDAGADHLAGQRCAAAGARPPGPARRARQARRTDRRRPRRGQRAMRRDRPQEHLPALAARVGPAAGRRRSPRRRRRAAGSRSTRGGPCRAPRSRPRASRRHPAAARRPRRAQAQPQQAVTAPRSRVARSPFADHRRQQGRIASARLIPSRQPRGRRAGHRQRRRATDRTRTRPSHEAEPQERTQRRHEVLRRRHRPRRTRRQHGAGDLGARSTRQAHLGDHARPGSDARAARRPPRCSAPALVP